jgi:hypothetical protein
VLRAALVVMLAVAADPVAELQVRVTCARPYLVLGTDGALDVTVEVSGPGAEGFVPSRALATVGSLELPRPAGAPGRFVARYTPPVERYPQVALLAVELAAAGGQRVHGATRLLLHGNTELPLRTEAGASVTVRVVDRTFGPVLADRQGHVKIPVQVPPGVQSGLARAVDQGGNVRETDVDLQPAPFPRVLIVAPGTIDAGSFVEVAVLAVDAAGDWVPAPRLTLRSSDGIAHPLGTAPGEARFLVEAPRLLHGSALALTAVAAGAPLGRADLAIPLRAGGPQTLALVPATRRLVVGSGATTQVAISAHDRFGNPVSAEGAVALVDHQPAPVQVTPAGQGLVSIAAPARSAGPDRITVEVSLGSIRATQEIRLTGGPPARLTLEVKDARLIADGQRGTELRVKAVDRKGTPTMIPGLSWETPGGRVRNVNMPREGEYVAEFVPNRAEDPHREVVAVMASEALRAGASVEVAPPPPLVLAAARVGFFFNLGSAAGPAAFVEALTPARILSIRFALGLTAGYLRDDIAAVASMPGGGGDTTVRLVIDQLPVMALARYRLPRLVRPELSFDVGAGVSFARTRFTTTPGTTPDSVEASAHAFAWQAGAETAFPLRPGRLVVGVRYLGITLGRTSHRDELPGNSAGLLADVGLRLSW